MNNQEEIERALGELFQDSPNSVTDPIRKPAQAAILQRDLDRERIDHEKSLEVYKTYQENIGRSSSLQSEILKGLRAGDSIYTLFLKAAEAISLMTGNSVFYSSAREDLIAIYGLGLLEKDPIRLELESVKKRLELLEAADAREAETDTGKRLQRSIEAHKLRIAELKTLIDRKEEL